MEKDSEKKTDIEILKNRLARLENAQTAASQAIRENNDLRGELYRVYTSNSWRITAPLRKMTDLLQKLKG